MFFITFSVYQILELMPINMGSYNIVHFVFFIMLFGDLSWARPRHGLAGEGP